MALNRYCDGVTRRDFLRVGVLGGTGLSLAGGNLSFAVYAPGTDSTYPGLFWAHSSNAVTCPSMRYERPRNSATRSPR